MDHHFQFVPHPRYDIDKTEIDQIREQRSRSNWLQHGDKNTPFFHNHASYRRQKNLIKVLFNDNGDWVMDECDMLELASDYFKEFFQTSSSCDASEIHDKVQSKVSNAMNEKLISPFTVDEVWQAVKGMRPLKASGADGFPALFSKGLSVLLNDANSRKFIKGATIGRERLEVGHLLFVDNSILFGEATMTSVANMKNILRLYDSVWKEWLAVAFCNLDDRNKVVMLVTFWVVWYCHNKMLLWMKLLPVYKLLSLQKIWVLLREASKGFESVIFGFVHRDANVTAHTLAREGRGQYSSKFWIEEIPPSTTAAATQYWERLNCLQ
ncbi:hypothetical protein V6N13_001149 [Hibiscus sabdariffa]